MSYPQQPGNWNDPSWPSQQPGAAPGSPYGDPAAAPPPASGEPAAPSPYGDPAAQSPYGDPAAAAAQHASPAGYPAPGYPTSGYAGPPPGYPGYGYGYPAPPATNGLAIAAMVVSIVGAFGLCGYGLGGYIGIVGAIMGHVARRQIRERGENGDGMALAGVVVGWIVSGIAIIATIVIVVAIVWAANQPTP